MFVEKCVPKHQEFNSIIRRFVKPKDAFKKMLVEGSEEESKHPVMKELSPHVRIRRELDLETYSLYLAERGNTT